MTELTVEIPEETHEETPVIVETGDTTVIVETPSEETHEETPDLALVVGGLVERVSQLETRLAETQVTAEIALETADVAVVESVAAEDVAEDVGEAVVEVADAVVNETPENLEETAEVVEDNSDSILPTKKHFVHRSFREIMGR